MFTGIIEEAGTVARITGGAKGGKVITVRSGFDPTSIALGDSIAVNGVCLTVTKIDGATFTVDAGPETLDRTTTGRLVAGRRVNLERAMALGERMGGHIVQGHVDGVGSIRTIAPRDNAYDLLVESPQDLLELIAPRGSITIDGISLTVTRVEAGAFGVSIIPHTWKATTLGERRVGESVNLEVDVIARYVARLLDARGLGGAAKGGLTEADLRAKGF